MLLLILAGVAASVLRPEWGEGTMALFGWAAGLALVLGLIGYRTLRAGMFSASQGEMVKHVLGGLFARFLLIIGTHAVWIFQFDSTWGQRALLSTVGLYMVALGLEVFTLNQELKRYQAARGSADATPVSAE